MADIRRLVQREPKDLRQRPIAGRRFARKYLFDADLRAVDGAGAVFDEAMLEGARFDGARLAGASFRHTHLAHAKLRDCDLTEAVFAHERHSAKPDHTANYAQFSRSRLAGADLSRAPLTYAVFEGASAEGAVFDRAVMVAAQMQGAILAGASFAFTDLSRARLEGADLRGANLRFADLSGANLTDVVVDESTVWRGARFNQRTRWFDGERRRPPL